MRQKRSKNKILGYAFLIPSLVIFAVFMLYPVLYTFYLSFFDWNMISPVKRFVGFQNYIKIFKDVNSLRIIGNTGWYILILLMLNVVMAYVLSFVLSFVVRKGKGFYKSTFFLPSVISLVVGSVLYTWILNPVSGPVALILQEIGISMPFWSTTEGWVIAVLGIIASWKTFGYNFIVILAGVSGVSVEVVEAAKLDNISTLKIFKDTVIPMSSATGIYVFITTIVQGLQYVFTPIKVITQGGPNYASSNMIYASYHNAFTLYQTGTSAAVSVITMVLFIILLFLEFRFVEKGVYYEN